MSYYRIVLLPFVACSVLLLLGSVGLVHRSGAARPEQTVEIAPVAPSSQPAPEPAGATDPGAVQALDRALALLEPKHLFWLEMELWQQVDVLNLTWVAEGHYLAAPGRRFRLDLKTERGGVAGTFCAVNDGTTLWQATRIGTGSRVNYSRMRLKEVLDRLDDPDTPPQVRDEFFRDQSWGGLTHLLPGLRRRMNWIRMETVRRDGRLFLKLWGTWTPAETNLRVPSGTPWPSGLPRQCRLYLDAETYWPHRLEWWGPDPPRPLDALLVQMEYRAPVLNRPLSDARCAELFRLEVDPILVPDTTVAVVDRLKARTQQVRTARTPVP